MNSWLLRMVVPAVLFLAALPMAQAHEDATIRLKGTKLVGLPEKYAPAEFDRVECRLRIGKHERKFPPLLRSLFEQPSDLHVTASWENNKRLPPYIALNIYPKGRDFSYKLLFNLDTLEVIEVYVVLNISESISQRLPIKLEDDAKLEPPYSIRTLE